LAAGRRAAGGFFARAGVVAAIVVFLVTVVHLDARADACAFIPYTNPTAMDSRTERLDGYWSKCINGLSNE